jgi:2-dehydro-3-deoxyphosphooctonate aldolase (KDO 8-P synthase)
MNQFFLIAGPCAIEDEAMAFHIAKEVKKICDDLDIHYIFKGSYEKANRSKLDSFTGIDKNEALRIHKAIRDKFQIENITDVHESNEPAEVAPFVTHLQIPAFLCRQSKLLKAAGESGCTVNIKKGQFLSPEAMKFAVEKVKATGNEKVWVCERGTTFGYNDLVVDATSISRMKKIGQPVVMDCTHSVQKPNQTSGVTGGDPELIEAIALSAIATGADGFFMEVHPEPHTAQSDPFTMLELKKLRPILEKCLKVRKALNS